MVSEPAKSESPIEWFRGIVQSLIHEEEVIKAPDVAREALSIAKKQRAQWSSYQDEIAYQSAYAEVTRILASTRKTAPQLKVVGDVAMTEAAAGNAFRQRFGKFWTWREHVGDSHIKLPKMTREELLEAANEREKRGSHELMIATVFRRAANLLEGGQTVGEYFTEVSFEALFNKIEGEFSQKLNERK